MEFDMDIMKKFFVSSLCFIFTACSSFAVELPSVMKETMAKETVGMPSLVNLIVSMLIVITLIYVTGWIYSKLNIVNRNKLKQLAKDESDDYRFTVLQSMPLGQQRHLYSIEMSGKILLVGSTPGHINLIKEFDKNEKSSENEEKQEFTPAEEQIRKAVDIDELYKKYKN